MIRAIIKIPSTPPIDAAIMGIRGLDEWPGPLPPNCAEEAVGLSCVEEAVASNCVGEAVAPGCVREVVEEVVVVVTFCVEIAAKVDIVSMAVINGSVDAGGQPNALQASTKQQPVYAGLAHDHQLDPPVHVISLLVVCWAVERKS